MAAIDPIEIASDRLRLRILPRGASLVGLRLDGHPRNLVLGFADPDDHARVPIYAGAIVGPVANRVRGGAVTIDGTRHQMPLNEAGRTALHSGPQGLHAQLWRVAEYAPDRVTLTCTLPDGACGLPGTRVFMAQYHCEGAHLTLTLGARTDRATPINLAAHPYWNLDGTKDISGHKVQVHASRYLPVDAHNLPHAAPAPVAGSLFDFTAPAPVPLDPALDVNFCLAPTPRTAPTPAAVLTGATGTSLHIATTAPGLQVYNGAYLPDTAPPTDGFPALAPYAGIALEPQHWPDAPNNRDFPDIILTPENRYTQVTRYTLGTN